MARNGLGRISGDQVKYSRKHDCLDFAPMPGIEVAGYLCFIAQCEWCSRICLVATFTSLGKETGKTEVVSERLITSLIWRPLRYSSVVVFSSSSSSSEESPCAAGFTELLPVFTLYLSYRDRGGRS